MFIVHAAIYNGEILLNAWELEGIQEHGLYTFSGDNGLSNRHAAFATK